MLKKLESLLSVERSFLVVGDIMLDSYIHGEIRRISPEAPVPVLTVTRRENRPGGAGNVAVNLRGLNSRVTLVGFTGEDESRGILENLFGENHIELKSLIWGRNTVTKTRIISSRQQIVRVDDEKELPLTDEEKGLLLSEIKKIDLSRFEGILISDYNKGTCFPELCAYLIGEGRKREIPVVIDPKGKDWRKYVGANLITPNVKELCEALGESLPNEDGVIGEGAQKLREELSVDKLIVTRSEKGMTLAWGEGIRHIPTLAKEVYDVSGAGDTVSASLLRFIADGLPINDCLMQANRAAGIVVGFPGTHPITADLLLHDRNDKGNWVEARRAGKTIVFSNGCFDLLHPGHLDYLKKARELGDFLVLGLNSDASVTRLKGEGRPVNNQESRKLMLESLRCVDQVILFEEDTPLELIRKIRPDILVKGGDYDIETIIGREYASRTLTVPFVSGYSSTSLMQRIKDSHGR